jgi:hypothetical protein
VTTDSVRPNSFQSLTNGGLFPVFAADEGDGALSPFFPIMMN